MKYRDNLEPNIKACPGGMRDVHLIKWLALFLFQQQRIRFFIHKDLIRKSEYQELKQALNFLLENPLGITPTHRKT